MWSVSVIYLFSFCLKEAVGKLVAEKFKPEFSLSDQDPEAKAELETEV